VREFSIVSGTTVQNPFAEVDFKTSGGSDTYNALQTQLSRRFNTGLTMNAQYTFAKSTGTTSGSNEARTAANNARTLSEWEYDRGANNFDVRHTFNLSAVYDLPVGKGKNYDLGRAGNALFGNVRRPDLIPGVNPYLNNDRNILNPSAFATPAPGTFGNLARNAPRGPGFWQSDLIFNKRIPLTEKVKLEFRTEIFNVFNHANFANPSSTLNVALPSLSLNATANAFVLGSGQQPGQAYTQSAAGSAFGLLRQTVERNVGLGTNRQIQFALRLNF
jgi:hypothetical protein